MKKYLLLVTALLICLASAGVMAGEMEYVNNGPDKTIHARPDPASEVRGTLYSESHLQVLGWQGGWANVAVNNVAATQTIGWVEGKNLVLVGQAIPSVAAVYNPNPRDRLNLRSAPREGAASLGKYYNGTAVDPLGSVADGWLKVRIGSIEGYMQAQYLIMGAQAGTVPSAMPALTVRNSEGTGLNLRLGQSTASRLLRFYPNGSRVRAMGLSPLWCHVETEDGYTGFMLARHLSPRLSYHLPDSGAEPPAPTAAPQPSAPAGGFDGWNGPVGYHPVAGWPLGSGNAAVSNPNPKDRLHLRSQPREGAPSLGKYYNDVQVDVDEVIPGGWSRVSVAGLDGYMRTEFLDFTGSTVSAMPLMTVYNPGPARNLHLRSAKSTASRSVGLYPNGTQVIVMGFDDTWAHVIAGGRIGFMQHRFLR